MEIDRAALGLGEASPWHFVGVLAEEEAAPFMKTAVGPFPTTEELSGAQEQIAFKTQVSAEAAEG